MNKDTLKYVQMITTIIADKKGDKILAVDVRAVSNMTDFCIIAEGNVNKHVLAIAQEIQNKMKDLGVQLMQVEGKEKGEWLVMDYVDIMVHLLTPSLREKYRLERLWADGKILNLESA